MSIGLTTNFIHNFDFVLVIIILFTAYIVKFGSVLLGIRFTGMKIDRQAMAIASGLDARGATGIILAGIGLINGLIDDRIFAVIFIMALATSFMAGSMIKFFLIDKIGKKLKGLVK